MIFHIVDQESWRAALSTGNYRGDTLATEGFIHCSTADQVLAVANLRFHGRRDLQLLEIDPSRVEPEIVYENLEGGEALYPHIYGSLSVDAVTRVFDFVPDAAGNFRLPCDLEQDEEERKKEQ